MQGPAFPLGLPGAGRPQEMHDFKACYMVSSWLITARTTLPDRAANSRGT